MSRGLAELRQQILTLCAEYARQGQGQEAEFVPHRSLVHFAGRNYDEAEVVSLVDAALDFWLTAGPNASRLERGLAAYVGARHCALVNSGSSANLLAVATLMSPRLGERRLRPGDEVITVAAGFPTTVAPLVQLGLVPVFVDVLERTANIDPSLLETARSTRTRAVMVAHTLGNPFDVDAVVDFCTRHDLYLVEDNCDALGAEWSGRHPGRTGSLGHLATSSFYPAHHMTTGEGGAVFTSDDELAEIALSLRDWGRDCYCKSGKDNTCGKRFNWQFGTLPAGYDHKYVYSHFGFNLKMTDLQAAVGLAQLDKLPGFVEARRRNHATLAGSLTDLDDVLRIQEPTAGSRPSWFGLLLRVDPGAPIDRATLAARLESSRVQTRPLFAGNLLRHPCFDALRGQGHGYRQASALTVTDALMTDALWIGVHPGLGPAELEHVSAVIHDAYRSVGARAASWV